MPTRQRFSTQTIQSVPKNTAFPSTYSREFLPKEVITEVSVGKDTRVIHRKLLQGANGLQRNAQGHYIFMYNHGWYGHNIPLPSAVVDAHQRNMASLFDSFDNNGFEIIPFLTDLDSTISMLTTKLFKSLTSYGAYEWGFKPLLSDIKSSLQSIRDITRGYDGYPKCTRVNRSRKLISRIEWKEGYLYPYPNIVAFDGTSRISGTMTFVPPDLTDLTDRAGALADEIGFHPDLKTLWDITPLSFVVDYFFPIGDLLESIHPRGWVNTLYFNGYSSIKGLYEVYGDVYSDQRYYLPALWRYYQREVYVGQIPITPPTEWKTPNIRQLFNTAYLALSSRR